MPGLWGIYTDRDRGLAQKLFKKLLNKDLVSAYNRMKGFRIDEVFITQEIYTSIQKSLMIHDSYGCMKNHNSRPFPSKRKGGCYVGRHYDPYYKCEDIFFFECPIECRPNNHSNWINC